MPVIVSQQDDHGCVIETRRGTFEIHISDLIPPEDRSGVVLHEVCEVALLYSGLAWLLSDGEREAICRMVEYVVGPTVLKIHEIS